MDDQFLSIKIKDGLFIGNKWTASDQQFLIANRFRYVLNCTSQIKNYFQTSGNIKYYKLKYSKTKPDQLLWKDNLKKLYKIMDFINSSEEQAECCLIHSNDGNNRCIAVAIAFMMVRYKWKLIKTLQFFETKNIEYKLSDNYLRQLKIVEDVLGEEGMMSVGWNKDNLDEEQLLLTNTYLNSINISFIKPIAIKKLERRIQWKDKIEKQQKIEKEKSKKTLGKQQQKSQKLQKSQKIEKIQKFQRSDKRMVKSEIIQTKKEHQKQSTRDTKEKQKNSNKPTSSVTKAFTKKNKDQRQGQQLQSGDSSTEDRPHNNRLINNFVNVGDQPKRTSKMAPRKSQQNIKMIRAFSEKEYNSYKESNKPSIPLNVNKQSLKQATKIKDNKTEVASKHYKSMQDGKIRAVSPKQQIRYKN